MTASAPTVSVIVLTYNARKFVEVCLAALCGQTYPAFEVIVVDNASADGTADFVRERFPHLKVIESPTNGGYGAGNNLGAAHANGEILAFLNPDAVPQPDWLEKLIGVMRQHGRNFATSKIVLQSNPARLNSGGNLVHYLGLSFCRGLNEPVETYNSPELVSGASGAACAISRELFNRVGGFDPSFFMYHDDVDLSIRALLAGEPCLYVPNAVVAHDYQLSVSAAKWAWIEAQRYAVLLKVFSIRTLATLLPALILVDLLTLAYLAKRGPEFVQAKLRSYGWVIRHAASIRNARTRARAVRCARDRDLLAAMADQIPYEQLASPTVARLAHQLLDSWFSLHRRLILSIVNW